MAISLNSLGLLRPSFLCIQRAMLLQLSHEEALSLTRFEEFAQKMKPQKTRGKEMGTKGRKNVKKPKKPKEKKK